jgi:ElaB/YqjD/DUF883 family membrane-anchored ribosome-binding protein
MNSRVLLADIDELLSFIAILKTPEVDAVRPRLEASLGRARRDLEVAGRMQAAAAVIREHPLTALAAGAVAGALVAGLLRAFAAWRRHSVR